MSDYKIQKDIPIYPRISRGFQKIYPFDKMAVGDSFFAPLSDLEHLRRPDLALINAAYAYKKRVGINTNFTSRKVWKNGKLIGYRIWRIK